MPWILFSTLFLLIANSLMHCFSRAMSLTDLYVVSLIGFSLSSIWCFRGFFASVFLLFCLGFWGHFFIEGAHSIRFAFETSLLCSFWMIAGSAEEKKSSQDEAHTKISALTEEGQHWKEEALRYQSAIEQERFLAAQAKEAFEVSFASMQAEKNAIEILNDVLRQANAALFLEQQARPLPALESVPFAAHRTPLPGGKSSMEDILRESLLPKRKKKQQDP